MPAARVTSVSAGCVLALMMVAGPVWAAAAKAEAIVRLQGSTTFAAEILEPYGQAIEREAGRPLEVVANKSSWGLFALLEGRVDLAMISAPLTSEIAAASRIKPGLAYDSLREFKVATTRIVFAVNPANPVTRLPVATVARILKGEIVNWREVGGQDRAIRVVAVKEGGGTVTVTRAQIMGGAPLAADAVRLESAKHVLKVVAQDPGAIGIAQASLSRHAGLHEIVTETTVEQPLSFVTLGAPDAAVASVIEATRLAVAKRRD